MTANSEMCEHYTPCLDDFTLALEKALIVSQTSTELRCSNRQFWASVLFARLCTSSISILSICPGSTLNPNGLHWDFGSIATLSRNLLECSLIFFYLGIEDVTEQEMKVRLIVMDLHDCNARNRMQRDLAKVKDSGSNIYEDAVVKLSNQLKTDTLFKKLPLPDQKSILKGQRACIYSQYEILSRMGEDASWIRAYYHFLSSHTHSLPVGFSRMADHGRGHGGENEIDKAYVTFALDFSSKILKRSTTDMRRVFSDIAIFQDKSFNWDSLRKTELTDPSHMTKTY
jgi:hypothetical protein